LQITFESVISTYKAVPVYESCSNPGSFYVRHSDTSSFTTGRGILTVWILK